MKWKHTLNSLNPSFIDSSLNQKGLISMSVFCLMFAYFSRHLSFRKWWLFFPFIQGENRLLWQCKHYQSGGCSHFVQSWRPLSREVSSWALDSLQRLQASWTWSSIEVCGLLPFSTVKPGPCLCAVFLFSVFYNSKYNLVTWNKYIILSCLYFQSIEKHVWLYYLHTLCHNTDITTLKHVMLCHVIVHHKVNGQTV